MNNVNVNINEVPYRQKKYQELELKFTSNNIRTSIEINNKQIEENNKIISSSRAELNGYYLSLQGKIFDMNPRKTELTDLISRLSIENDTLNEQNILLEKDLSKREIIKRILYVKKIIYELIYIYIYI